MGNELVFRAADTATALEKVQDNLGENAFIIEIKNVGNFVEITASLQEPAITKGGSKAAPKKSVLVLPTAARKFHIKVARIFKRRRTEFYSCS